MMLPQKEYKLGGADAENRLRNLRYARATDNYAIAVGKGGSFAFGHGGPGEFQDKLLQKNENEEISIYETGVKKLVRKHPHFYHNYDHPLESLDAAEDIVLPNASDPGKVQGNCRKMQISTGRMVICHTQTSTASSRPSIIIFIRMISSLWIWCWSRKTCTRS